ncbi:Diguanylate cyclase [Bosea sp. LC85]|uniref:GGDEF domain-containing protein n=1 Tax=Bosea sp. LC85 TaxID=1502851 RepID=UPI0004E2B0D0|nr:GGDEF domain-containing protein [Bosea sp. LC85]KFC72775.1 Diguanylate cyclase [Bosea sp. LC85]
MDETTQQLIEMLEDSPVLVALYDQFDRLRKANRAFRQAYSIHPNEDPTWSEIMRRNFSAQTGTVVRTTNFEEWLISTQSRRGKVGYRAFETDLHDGRWLWMNEMVSDDGWMLCIASVTTDLHSDKRALRQDRDSAVKASYTDELTGVANRRFVMARIDDMLLQRRRDSRLAGCLAVLDIDHFKAINDRFGHAAGDEILCRFAKEIHANVRRSDCFGRVGGEEFVLVMPRTSAAEAALVLERMLILVRAMKPLGGHGDYRCTFSAGIAETDPADVSLSLYSRADKALYAAKSRGRNCIVVAEGDGDRSASSQLIAP